jgi:SAM-dependent methyltransferase
MKFVLLKRIKSSYNYKYAEGYRVSDDLIKDDPEYWRLREFILKFFNKINGKKSVLEIGCGTGRYFYLFDGQQVDRFIGIDLSENMLQIAKYSPPYKEEISINPILICDDFMNVTNIGKFDFVYSIGVLGEHMPFNNFIMQHINDNFLKEGAIFIFTAVCWFHRSWRRRLINKLFDNLKLTYLSQNFYTREVDIIKILKKEKLRILEFQIWNEKYPHYLVAVEKNE